jgi:hypothetical protein
MECGPKSKRLLFGATNFCLGSLASQLTGRELPAGQAGWPRRALQLTNGHKATSHDACRGLCEHQ